MLSHLREDCMKGPKEMKRYVAKWRKELNKIGWDDLAIFKWEKCKKWFKREKKISKEDWQ